MPANDASSDAVTVDVDAMRATAESFQRIHQSIEDGFRRIGTEIDALVGGGWSGTAADNLRRHFDTVGEQTTNTLADAHTIVAQLNDTVTQYVGTDRQNAETVAQPRALLNLG